MDPKEYMAALGVLAKSDSSEEEKASALEKLSAFGESMIDDKEKSSESGDDDKPKEDDKEKSSENGDDDEKKDEPSKEMASVLAKIDEQNARLAKLEKASAVGNAKRNAKPTVIPRTEPAPPPDPVTQMIDNAVAASRRSAGK